MKLNVGDYVRTKTGIHKIFKINENATVWKYLCDKKPTGEWDGSYEYTTIKEENIIKSSPNIIDLIEVGDYVDGARVTNISKEQGKNIEIYLDTNDLFEQNIYKNEDIKSIVTKEQFEAMQYIVKED